MTIDEFFNMEPEPPPKISRKDFEDKTKLILNNIVGSYSVNWQSRSLKDAEYPPESVCDACAGFGTFSDEQLPCVQDRVEGQCYHRFCDYEQVGIDVESHLEDMCKLLECDITDTTST